MNNSSSRRILTLWRLPLFSLVLASAPLSSYSQVNAEQVINIGRNVLSMDDYMLSIHYFNQAIKAKPYLADPYFFRAVAKLNLDDFKGAEDDCTLALERNKFKMEAYKVRGFARQCLGLDSLAIDDYNVGLSYNPLDKYFLFYKAVAQSELKQYEKSDSTFSILLRQYPRFEEGFAARGRLNLAKGDTVAAIADLDQALRLSKSLINPYLLKAEIAWKRKDWNEAGENIDAAIRLRPEVADLYVNRAFIKYNSDDFFGAMSDYNYALQLEPDNSSALFNRALLRYEVKDLSRAEEDLSSVLKLEPTNFHALYNRGLIRMEQKKSNDALEDFRAIARQYPKFYPVYYALAETKRQQGDLRGAMQYVREADELVKRYVRNPEKNPLDRPAIAAAESKDAHDSNNGSSEESEMEVMEKFNRLITVSDAVENQLSYNEKIKGRVQDRNVQVEPEPMFALTFNSGPQTLRSVSNYFRELDVLNQQHYINRQIYLNPLSQSPYDGEETSRLFEYADNIEKTVSAGNSRPVDLLALGIARTVLKNYPAAIECLDAAIDADPNFTVAYMARAFARYANSTSKSADSESSPKDGANDIISHKARYAAIQKVIDDLDKAISLNPRLVFALFNKGNIYYDLGDYQSAMKCYSDAIAIYPDFGEAYFNRGLSYLRSGNKSRAFSDLSKAGELGVLPSYNILKRMK